MTPMTACRPKGIKTITFYYFIDFVLVLFPDGQKHARVATIVVVLLLFLVSLSLYRVLIVAWSNHINVLDIIIIDVVALVEGLPPQDMSVVSSQPSSCGRRCCCYYYGPISRRVVVGSFEAEDTRNSPISTAAAD